MLVRQVVARQKEPVGRTLDFLAQEMNREINTIGSKANDSLISREVVTLKAELEKFQERPKTLNEKNAPFSSPKNRHRPNR